MHGYSVWSVWVSGLLVAGQWWSVNGHWRLVSELSIMSEWFMIGQ